VRLQALGATFIRREVRIEPVSVVKAAVFAIRPIGPFNADDFEIVVRPVIYHVHVDNLSEADGVSFLCPKCFPGHSVICWFTGKVPDDAKPSPGRWNPSGTSIDNLTFVGPGAASVELLGGCLWHGAVVNGDAT